MSILSKAGEWALRNGHGRVVAAVTTLVYGLKDGRQRHFSIDSDGQWVNRQRDATFVSPTVHARYFTAVDDEAVDTFEYGYRLQPGDVVVDIGAGIGTEIVTFSRNVGDTGKVIAIEAHPATYLALTKTIALSGLRNVVPVQAAIGASNGTLTITDESLDHIANSITDIGAGSGTGRSIQVTARTMDTLMHEHGLTRIDLLKINIEGAEKLAIQGMDEAIRVTRNVAISCHDFLATPQDRGTATLAEVTAFLERAGFTLTRRLDELRPWVRDTIYGSRA